MVVDSVAALVPRTEIEGDMGDAQVGLQARLMSQALRKLTGVVAKSRTCLIFINQLREKIGVMFGSPETTTGGRALKFYSSVRIDIRRIGAIKDADRVVGGRTRVKVVKKQTRCPVPRSGIRHHVWRRYLTRGRSSRPCGLGAISSRRAGRGSLTAESVWDRAVKTSSVCSKRNRRSSSWSSSAYGKELGLTPQEPQEAQDPVSAPPSGNQSGCAGPTRSTRLTRSVAVHTASRVEPNWSVGWSRGRR